MADIFAPRHVQAPYLPMERSDFNGAVFIGYLGSIKRDSRGGAVITINVEREQVQGVLPLWDAQVPLSFNVEPWQLFDEALYDE